MFCVLEAFLGEEHVSSPVWYVLFLIIGEDYIRVHDTLELFFSLAIEYLVSPILN